MNDADVFLEELLEMISGAQMSQAIATAADLGIVDLLADGPRPVAALAAATRTHPSALQRLLRALASCGLLSLDDGSHDVRLLPKGSLLRSDHPAALHAYCRWWGAHRWAAWSSLPDGVATNARTNGGASGRSGMKDLHGDPAAATAFHGAMTALTRAVARGVLPAFNFSSVNLVADIGGGSGELMAALLREHPHLRGMLLDLPHAMASARQYLSAADVLDRCDLVAGSFFDGVPAGADIYLMKTVLHDWTDEECAPILACCHEAIAATRGARLLVVERVLPDRIESSRAHRDAALADLNMLVMLGGRERTTAEFQALLGASGFAMVAIRDAAMGYSVIEAIPTNGSGAPPPATSCGRRMRGRTSGACS